MKITLLGTGFAVPWAGRVQSGFIAETDDGLFLFDCGSGILQRIVQAGYDIKDIDAVIISHFHLDHTSDLLALMKARWIKGVVDMRVIGPRGLGEWLNGLLCSYPYMKDRFELDITEMAPGDTVHLGNATLECAPAHHAPESLAYYLGGGERSLVYSGDTKPCPGIHDLCLKGADLLIHECSYMEPGKGAHTIPASLLDLLEDLPVKKVALTHFAPETEAHLEEMVKIISFGFPGDVIVGEDLMIIDI